MIGTIAPISIPPPALRMPTQAELLDLDLRHLIHPLHNHRLHEVHGHVWVRGEGPLLFDADGKRFIDALSGLWNVVAGHGRQ
jgi:adenosylmethionine-8-amino-7-oxononanoate aminotransferase